MSEFPSTMGQEYKNAGTTKIVVELQCGKCNTVFQPVTRYSAPASSGGSEKNRTGEETPEESLKNILAVVIPWHRNNGKCDGWVEDFKQRNLTITRGGK